MISLQQPEQYAHSAKNDGCPDYRQQNDNGGIRFLWRIVSLVGTLRPGRNEHRRLFFHRNDYARRRIVVYVKCDIVQRRGRRRLAWRRLTSDGCACRRRLRDLRCRRRRRDITPNDRHFRWVVGILLDLFAWHLNELRLFFRDQRTSVLSTESNRIVVLRFALRAIFHKFGVNCVLARSRISKERTRLNIITKNCSQRIDLGH